MMPGKLKKLVEKYGSNDKIQQNEEYLSIVKGVTTVNLVVCKKFIPRQEGNYNGQIIVPKKKKISPAV